MPTRVTNTTATLIDQIYSKNYESSQNSYSGILVSKISDHFPIFTFKPCFPNYTRQPKKIEIRKQGPVQLENFMTELSNYDWMGSMLNQTNVDVENCFSHFFDTLNQTLHLIWNSILAAQFPTIVVYLMDTVEKLDSYLLLGRIASCSCDFMFLSKVI